MSSRARQIAKRVKNTRNNATTKDRQKEKSEHKPRKRTKTGVIYTDSVK